MIDFFKKNHKWFTWAFLALFLLKSCQSSNRERYYIYNQTASEIRIDSLKNVIWEMHKQISLYKDSLHSSSVENDRLKDHIQILMGTNKHYQQINKILIENNKQQYEESQR